MEFSKKFPQKVFDIDALRIQELKEGHDRTLEVEDFLLSSNKTNIEFCSDIDEFRD